MPDEWDDPERVDEEEAIGPDDPDYDLSELRSWIAWRDSQQS